MVSIEKLKKENIDTCFKILDEAREFQEAQGFVQWTKEYPSRNTLEDDLVKGIGYEILCDGKIAGYMALCTKEVVYDQIDTWKIKTDKYIVIHRMGISKDFRGKNIPKETFDIIAKYAKEKEFLSLRIDTMRENKRMQHVLEKAGFVYCGDVVYTKNPASKDSGLRVAYERVL